MPQTKYVSIWASVFSEQEERLAMQEEMDEAFRLKNLAHRTRNGLVMRKRKPLPRGSVLPKKLFKNVKSDQS